MQYEKIFKKMITQAIENKATDIHLELSTLRSHCEYRTLQGLVRSHNIKVVPELFIMFYNILQQFYLNG